MLKKLRAKIRDFGLRTGLIEYCARCDGSINEEEARGYDFQPDRWLWHFKHERDQNDMERITPLYSDRRKK